MGLDMYLHSERYLGAYDKANDYAVKPLPCIEQEQYRLVSIKQAGRGFYGK